MGWFWKNDEDKLLSSGNSNSRYEESCSTRKIVKSLCRTEEVEPGRFVQKCEKTEEILRDCIGRPAEVVRSNKEYDVTEQVLKEGAIENAFKGSLTFDSSDPSVFGIPGDIDASLFGRFFDAFAAKDPFMFDEEPSSSSSMRPGAPKPEEPATVGDDLPSSAPEV